MATKLSTEDGNLSVSAITGTRTRVYKDIDLTFTNKPSGEIFKKESAAAVKQAVKNLLLTNYFEKPFQPNLSIEDILTKEALDEMDFHTIPDLKKVCLDLYQTFFTKEATNSATQFISVFKEMEATSPAAFRIFERNYITHTLVLLAPITFVVTILTGNRYNLPPFNNQVRIPQ